MNTATALKKIIQEIIHQTGPLTVAEYMNICLSHEKYGYYKTQKIFGQTGDFTTAPEISQVFGELLAIWLLTAWQQQNSPKKFILCEAGPGRGTLMYDLLRTITKLNPQML
ncbi:MAG: SAM-dependent methyltransferase, partial [Alphaproteobacteria bacterium]|nr:SAM-dependent methyltransferase [Alphaproteobacteria bacterium]